MSIGDRDAPDQRNEPQDVSQELADRRQEAEQLADGDMSLIISDPTINGISRNFFKIAEEIRYADRELDREPLLSEDATPGEIYNHIADHLMKDIKSSMEIT